MSVWTKRVICDIYSILGGMDAHREQKGRDGHLARGRVAFCIC